jgi:hypothetical protein
LHSSGYRDHRPYLPFSIDLSSRQAAEIRANLHGKMHPGSGHRPILPADGIGRFRDFFIHYSGCAGKLPISEMRLSKKPSEWILF